MVPYHRSVAELDIMRLIVKYRDPYFNGLGGFTVLKNCRVAATSILGGLHHEYRLEKIAA